MAMHAKIPKTAFAIIATSLLVGAWGECNPYGFSDAGCEAEDYSSMLQKATKSAGVQVTSKVDPELERAMSELETLTTVASSSTSLDKFFQPIAPPVRPPGVSDHHIQKSVDEHQTAPSTAMCFLLFFTFAFGIFFTMVVVLNILQMFWKYEQRHQEEFLANFTPAECLKKKAEVKKPKEKKAKATPEGFIQETGAKQVGQLMNGDHERLDMLLSMADAKDPKAASKELVKKAASAYKLKLSNDGISQAAEGLTALMTAAKNCQKKYASPKVRLQRAMKQVLLMVKVGRAFKTSHHEVDEWTCTAKHGEATKNAWSSGEKKSTFKDSNLKHYQETKGWFGAYLASEKCLDHQAIAFIFFYSQTCAVVYAFYLKNRFPAMYEFMGPWVLVSRGEAMAAIVLTMLMVMLLSRGLITGLRRYMSWSTVLQTICDKHVLIHRMIGAMLVFCVVLHVTGHLLGSIPAIINEHDNSKVSAAFTFGTKVKFNFNSWSEALTCWPAVTGMFLLCTLTGFWALSNERVRRYSFELFQYPHMVLIFFWCGGLIAHGWKQWLGIGIPLGAIAVAPVVFYWAYDRITSIYAGCSDQIIISNAIIKKRQVMVEIDTQSSGYQYDTGMYCMLMVPDISIAEWHPFTIASGGGSQKFQVLIAVAGDWTTRLKELLEGAQKPGCKYPRICARGGFGAPAEGMKDHKNIVMVGSGVGATPFLAFLSSICHSAKTGVHDQFKNLESATMYWVSREPDDFCWVNEYANIIAATPGLKEKVTLRICLTKKLEAACVEGCSAAEVALFWIGVQVAIKELDHQNIGKELGVPTQFGRPDWKKELTDCVDALKTKTPENGEPVELAVFACGNAMLVGSLEEACEEVTDETANLRLFAEEF